MNEIYIVPAIIAGVFAFIGQIVSGRLKSKFKHYSQVRLQNGMTGAQIAQKMLDDHGIHDVKIIQVRGQLTDHYNPVHKTVNLSEVVYHEANAAAAAVAAHEVGHAVQHAVGYKYLQMRSKLVPVVNIASRFVQWVILAGVAMITVFPQLIWIGIALFASTTLFSVITLPVEFDASNRALAWMKDRNITTSEEQEGAADALKWAARTYIVAALASLAQLLYYLSYALNRRN